MNKSLDDLIIEITCPYCLKTLERSIHLIKTNNSCCPQCGSVFKAEAFRKEIAKVEEILKLKFNK